MSIRLALVSALGAGNISPVDVSPAGAPGMLTLAPEVDVGNEEVADK